MSQVNEVEGYCLRWNNHEQSLIDVLQSLYLEQSFVDVTLAAEGKSIQVHRLVLSACSPYFQELLSQHSDKQAIIFLNHVSFNQLEALVEYMYKGEINIAQDQISALLNTAESLQIKGLTDGDWKMNNVKQSHSIDLAKTSSSSANSNRETSSVASLAMPFLNTTTSSITQGLHHPIYTHPPIAVSQASNSTGGMSNGNTFAIATKTDAENEGSVPNSENEEWSDADLGPSTPHPTPVEVVIPSFAPTTPFPHVSWGESLAAAAAAAAAVAAATAVPGPSGLQNSYLQVQQATAAAIPTPIINPVRAKPPRKNTSRRNTRPPSTTTLIQDKPYVCPRCGRCYSRRGALIQHQRYECGIEPQFSCPMCPYKIKRKDSLNRHIRNMHHNQNNN